MNSSWRMVTASEVSLMIVGLGALLLGTPGSSIGSDADPNQGESTSINNDVYQVLGNIPQMHKGRIKPSDSVARQVVKSITGRQSFEPIGPDGTEGAEWSAIATLISWQAAPEFWNEQRFILAEYLPLRQLILADSMKAALAQLARDSSEADAAIKPLLEQEVVTSGDLKGLARTGLFDEKDQRQIEALAQRLDGHEKFLSPAELEQSELSVSNKNVTLLQWYMDIGRRSQTGPLEEPVALSRMERKVREVVNRLLSYQAIRGGDSARPMRNEPPVDHLIPRGVDDSYIDYLEATVAKYEKFVEENGPQFFPRIQRVKRDPMAPKVVLIEPEGSSQAFPANQYFNEELPSFSKGEFSIVECDALLTLAEFYSELALEDRLRPGEDDVTAQNLLVWLREDADWAPVSLFIEGDLEELVKAGYDRESVTTFRDAYQEVMSLEATNPGMLELGSAERLVQASRELGSKAPGYPSVATIEREVAYNEFAPFYRVPGVYGLAFLLLGTSMMLGGFRQGIGRVFRLASYTAGLAALIGGIALESYGFAMRVLISGWAPVTTLYETVVWVALVAAVIGLILEVFHGRGYAGTAAAGVAMLCSIIAANAQSVLDPNIEALQPVLRSNYWLTIHVLTIVSSYAAFALALGLGMIGTLFYLTAPSRRDASIATLSLPLLVAPIPGALGALAIVASKQGILSDSTVLVSLWEMTLTAKDALFFTGWCHAGTGIVMAVMGVSAILGELIARGSVGAKATRTTKEAVTAGFENTTEAQEKSLAAVDQAQGATQPASARPSIEEIRRRVSDSGTASSQADDPREAAILARSEVLKPLGKFIDRAIQVGVVLVAAGTILGGVWADVSWGRFWGWDPKEVSALVTLVIYLIPLHGRFAGWINSFGLTAASVLCFNSVLLAWYGVNFLLGVGLHSYGFAEGANQGAVLLTALCVSSVTGGAIWRRLVSQRTLASTT